MILLVYILSDTYRNSSKYKGVLLDDKDTEFRAWCRHPPKRYRIEENRKSRRRDKECTREMSDDIPRRDKDRGYNTR